MLVFHAGGLSGHQSFRCSFIQALDITRDLVEGAGCSEGAVFISVPRSFLHHWHLLRSEIMNNMFMFSIFFFHFNHMSVMNLLK